MGMRAMFIYIHITRLRKKHPRSFRVHPLQVKLLLNFRRFREHRRKICRIINTKEIQQGMNQFDVMNII